MYVSTINCPKHDPYGAMIATKKRFGKMSGNVAYHKANPCPVCTRLMIQAGINNVYMRVGEGVENYIVIPAKDPVWVQET